jgi:HD-GYP domain-containing protein (c-di-GMP phosphodiesterase class II)
MKKRVAVKDLNVGMYVVQVTKSTGSAIMTSKGVIKHLDAIKKLKSLGVKEVEIDASKSVVAAENLSPETSPSQNETLDTSIERNATPLASEMRRAKSMYADARTELKNTFETLKRGGDIDIAPYEDIAQGFFESVFRNQDALLCMTKLQDKDNYLFEHSLNVAILLAIFSIHLGFSENLGTKLTLAGLLHDLGKSKISDDILFKQGKLSKDEFEIMKLHTVYGEDILSTMNVDDLTKQIALQHHERLSGSGYPHGLIAHQINQYVRMSSIADSYDAITAERVYKPAISSVEALRLLQQSQGKEYDDDLINKFVRAIGLYSIGTVVLMKSQMLAIVTDTNYEAPLKPSLTAFYHTKFKRHIEPSPISLQLTRETDAIEKVVNAEDYQLDINLLIERFILDSYR